MLANKGRSSIAPVLAIAMMLVLSSSISISSLSQVGEEIADAVKLEEGIEIVNSKSYRLSSNVKWNRIKAAGIKIKETSLKGFLQICERLALDLGSLQLYVDFEARVMWVYSDPSTTEADREAYYVQFTKD